jgi:hypothetical protein
MYLISCFGNLEFPPVQKIRKKIRNATFGNFAETQINSKKFSLGLTEPLLVQKLCEI